MRGRSAPGGVPSATHGGARRILPAIPYDNERWDPRGERWPTLLEPQPAPTTADGSSPCLQPRVARDNSLAVVSSPFTNLPGRVAQAKMPGVAVPAFRQEPAALLHPPVPDERGE